MFLRAILVLFFVALPGLALADCSDDPQAERIRAACDEQGFSDDECDMYIADMLGDCEKPDVEIPRYTNPEIEECPDNPDGALKACIEAGGNPQACQERLDLAVALCPAEPQEPPADEPRYTNPEIEECPDNPDGALKACIEAGGNPQACQERLDLAVALCPTVPQDPPADEPRSDPRIQSCPENFDEAVMMCVDQIGETDRCVELVEEAMDRCD